MAEQMGIRLIAGITSAGAGCAPARVLALTLMAGVTGGCMGLDQSAQDPAPGVAQKAVPAPKTAPRLVLVADPDTFQAEDFLLWNGEETLRGRWIAFPDLGAARQVRVTNGETGAVTDAAMLRRDAGAAGPRIIVSSQAADALGLVPGHATQVTIEALTYADPAAVEAAAATKPDAEPGEDLDDQQTTEDQEIAQPADPPAEDEAPIEISAIYGGGEEAEAGADEAGSLVALFGAALEVLSPESTSDPTVPEAEAAAPLADPAPAATGPLYIRAGTFENAIEAEALGADLREAGMTVEIRAPEIDEAEPTQVLVGPYDSVEARDQALEQIRAFVTDDAVPAEG
ncbi:MAG: SPOR domain-containing protein [Paracoccaceae bacterium]|nr:SPOR domain-containing protein [Paracoccaceae bacterium]